MRLKKKCNGSNGDKGRSEERLREACGESFSLNRREIFHFRSLGHKTFASKLYSLLRQPSMQLLEKLGLFSSSQALLFTSQAFSTERTFVLNFTSHIVQHDNFPTAIKNLPSLASGLQHRNTHISLQNKHRQRNLVRPILGTMLLTTACWKRGWQNLGYCAFSLFYSFF